MEIEGIGAHGKVVKAFHIKERNYFALKYVTLLEDISTEDELMKNIEEAQLMELLNTLKSPNIISLFDHGYTQEVSCNLIKYLYVIKMEYASCTLKEILDERQKQKLFYNKFHAFYIFEMILSGLIAAKSLGITHRDIKDANILIHINEKNQDINYKIAD